MRGEEVRTKRQPNECAVERFASRGLEAEELERRELVGEASWQLVGYDRVGATRTPRGRTTASTTASTTSTAPAFGRDGRCEILTGWVEEVHRRPTHEAWHLCEGIDAQQPRARLRAAAARTLARRVLQPAELLGVERDTRKIDAQGLVLEGAQRRREERLGGVDPAVKEEVRLACA